MVPFSQMENGTVPISINVDTGEIYDTLKDAVDKTHIQNISACCRGVRTKAGGFRWKYIN